MVYSRAGKDIFWGKIDSSLGKAGSSVEVSGDDLEKDQGPLLALGNLAVEVEADLIGETSHSVRPGSTARSTPFNRMPRVIAITTPFPRNSFADGGSAANHSFRAVAARGRVRDNIREMAVVRR